MKISSINQPDFNNTFKAISIVQVPHQAFKQPKDVKLCTKEFNHSLTLAYCSMFKGFFRKFTSILFPQANSILESPSYYITKSELQKHNIGYSISWFRNNSGLPVKDAIDETCHSFFVFTKEDKSIPKDAIKKPFFTKLQYAKEGVDKYPTTDNPMYYIYMQSRIGIDADRIIEQYTKNTTLKKIKINNLDEVKNIINEIKG